MSAISLKSISGITSITTPAGVDNQLTLHNNNTTEAVKLDTAGNLHFHNHLNITGVSTASNFKTGTSNLHNTGLNVQDLDVDGHTNLDNVNIAGVTTFSSNTIVTDGSNYSITQGSSGVFAIAASEPRIRLIDNESNPNYSIYNTSGVFRIHDETSNVNRLTISSSGNVSITNDLDVDGHTNLDNVNIAGVTTFSNATTIVNGGYHRGIINSGAQAKIIGGYISGSDTLRLGESMYLTSGGLGLGDSAPPNFTGYRSLSIHGSTGGALVFGDDGTDEWEIYGGDGVIKIYDRANTTERFRITDGGKIGVNQTGPFADVDITSSVEDTDDSALSAHGIRLAHVGATDEEVIPITAGFVTQQARARAAIGFISKRISGADGMGGAIGFYTRNTADGHALYRADERLRITEAGKVGIGTDNPKQPVSINNGRVSIDVRGDYYGAWIDGDSSGTSSFNVGRWHNAGGRMRSGGSSDNDLVVETQNTSHNLQLQPSGTGKVGVGDDDPVVKLHVKGSGNSHATLNVHTSIEDTTSYAANVGGLQVFEGRYNSANSPAVFSAIHGGKENATDGNYAGYLRFLTRAHGAMPVEVARIASNGFMGVKTPDPQTELNVIGTVSTGRNVARELGTIINISSNHDGSRVGANVINGVKEYEVGADWLAQGNARVNANLTIELPQAYTCDRFVIYNQNEYNNSRREVKNFTLEGSNDNSNWTTILDDDCGASNAHEPNPGFSFRMPASFADDDEGVTYRYWRFTMKTFHGSDSYGGIMELELYQHHQSVYGRSETTTHSLNATDMAAETLQGIKRLYASKGMNIYTNGLTDTWELTETGIVTSGSYTDKSTIRHKRGVMAVSSSYNTGDLNIRIDNLYNLPGNAWWTFGLWIMTNQTVGTLAGHHSYMIHVVMTGLGSWSSMSANNIQGSGSGSVSVVAHGSNYVELKVDVNDSSRGPCTVLCNGGTFDPPRISFH